jgi:outer membrane receptor protein involved in Fe transport
VPRSPVKRKKTDAPTSAYSAAPARVLSTFVAAACMALAQSVAANAAPDLTEMSLEQLMDVTIVAASRYEQKQNDVAAAAVVITRADMKAHGWRTIDEALASLPGTYVTYDRQYKYLGSRGFSIPGDFNTRLLLTIDGNRLNDPIYDSAAMGDQLPIDIDLIERIEFIPGPGGAVYGQNAMFGVINLVTRAGTHVDGAELAVSFQYPQERRKGRATYGTKFDNGLDLLVSVSKMRSSGEDLALEFPGATPSSGIAGGLDGASDEEFLGRMGMGAWTFEYVYGGHHKEDPTGAYLSDPLLRNQYQGDSYKLGQIQFRQGFADDSLALSARLFAGRERYGSHLSYGGPFSFSSASNWYGGELHLLASSFEKHKLLLGLEAQDNTRLDQNVRDKIDSTNDVHVHESGYRVGAFLQDEWRITEALSATWGARVDRNNVMGTKLSPRAGLIWKASDQTTTKILYGHAFRAPNSYESDYEDGVSLVRNPSLKGETIDTLELVIDHAAGNSLLLHGSIYRWEMAKLVTLGIEPQSLLPQYRNSEDVEATGIELSLDKSWSWSGRLRGSIAYQDAGYKSGGDLSNSPQWLGKLDFTAALADTGLRLAMELQYSDKRQAIDDSDVDGYWLSNLRLIADRWVEGLEISLNAYNLFDERYEHPGADSNWQTALEQDDRQIALKLEYRL